MRLVLTAPGWLLSAALVGSLGFTPLARAAPPDAADAETPEQAKQRARAEVRTASTAFSEGDYATAIVHYEAAMAILPAPKLHYNLGVCHQRLSLEAESSEQRTRERDLAIQSYNTYLEQNPRAEDRLEVAELIRELGGTPVTMPALKPLFEDEPEPEPEAPDTSPAPTQTDAAPAEPATPPDPPPAAPPPPLPRHGRFGVNLLGGYSPGFAGAALLDARALFATELYGGGMLGPKRRFLLSAHTLLYFGLGGGQNAGLALPVAGYSLGLLGQQNWTTAGQRLLLGVGLSAALTGQSVGVREDVEAQSCSLDTLSTARRSGGAFGSRFELALLIGPHRRAHLSAILSPTIAVFGDGPLGETCEAGETPWTALGLRQRWQLQLWGGGGFGFRF